MKTKYWIAAGLLTLSAMVNGVGPTSGFAQEQTPFAGMTLDSLSSGGTVQYQPISINYTDLASLENLTDPQLEAFLGELSVTPQLATNALPLNGECGTFFSLQHPNWPPLPGDISGVPVWQMDGFYLLNDLNHNYAAEGADAPQSLYTNQPSYDFQAVAVAAPQKATAKVMVASGSAAVKPEDLSPSTLPVLTIVPTGTNQLLITITNPSAPENYELLATPVLANSAYPWTPIAVGTSGQTSFIVTMGSYYTGFFQALQDTNAIPLWEAADPNNQATGVLSVWIDSPANGAALQ